MTAARSATHGEPVSEPGKSVFGPRLMLVLALLSATGPLSMDLYLPSFPQIADALQASASEVQLTFTAFVVGLGIGQILWGPFADRYGRLRPLLVGTVLCVIASALVAMAPTIELLVAARFAQALTAAAGVVVARAIVADTTRGYAAVHTLSILTTITMIAPVVAPIAGSVLAVTLDWRGVLWTLFAVTVLMFVGSITTVRETLPIERRARRLDYGNLARVLRRPVFVGYVLTATFGFGTMVAYIAASSFVYQTVIGFTEIGFGIAFAVNASGLIAAGLISARLAKRRVHPARVVFTALPVVALMAISVLLIAVTGAPAVLLVIPLFFAVSGTGFITGNTMALALEEVRDVAGSGSAIAGGLQFMLAGMVTPLVGLAGEASVFPLGIVMASSSLVALAAFAIVRSHARRHPREDDAFAKAPATA